MCIRDRPMQCHAKFRYRQADNDVELVLNDDGTLTALFPEGIRSITPEMCIRDSYNMHEGSYYFITRYGEKTPSEFNYKEDEGKDIYLVFGKESTGIDKHILHDNYDRCVRIPMVAQARSLNLSNCVAICVYEVLDQLGFPNLSHTEVIKGKDFLQQFE